MTDSLPILTPTEQAIIDLERQKVAHMARRAVITNDPAGERADRFSTYAPNEIEAETRAVRLDLSFLDVIAIRDQCSMIIAAMTEIQAITTEHHKGAIKQRMECRRVADAVRRTLARSKGQVPRGDTKPKREPTIPLPGDDRPFPQRRVARDPGGRPISKWQGQ